jgi:hypothetical protein
MSLKILINQDKLNVYSVLRILKTFQNRKLLKKYLQKQK